MKGQIEKFAFDKGFGFILTEEGESIFFHRADFKENIFCVEFDIKTNDRGKRAVAVRRKGGI